VANSVRTGLTRSAGRRFGLTVGAAFFVIAAAAWQRQHTNAATLLALVGGVLVVAGLAVPVHLGPVERAWMALAHLLSRVTTPIVMSAIYFGVFWPIGVLRRGFGGNPLEHKAIDGSFWRERPEGARRTGSMRRQF
jgi:hypothetical protein